MDLRSSVSFFLLCVVVVKSRDIRPQLHTRDTDQAGGDLPSTTNVIEVLSVERRSTGENQNTFTVRFTKNVPDLRLEVFDFSQPFPESGTEDVGDDGVTTFTFSINKTESIDAVFQATKLDRTSSVILVLDNSIGETVREDVIQIAEFRILPAGDIVYQPGQDAQFKVLVTEGSERPDQWDHPLSVRFHVLDITEQTFKNVYNIDSMAERTQAELAGGINETTITVKTSEHPVTGMVDVTYSWRGEMGDLISETLVSRSRVMRPSVLSDVFPTGYIGFVEKERDESCKIGKECTVSCVAVGNSLSSIQVQEVVNGEMQGQITTAREPHDPYPYNRYLTWQVSTSDQASAGETRLFRCLAQDNVHGTESSQDVDVLVSMEAAIDEERSNVVLQTNGNMTEASLTCAVHGYPKPNMTFNLEYEYAHYSGASPDTIINEGNNAFLMVKSVIFNPNEGHGGYFHDPTGRLLSATCETYQPGTYTYNSYSLPFHDLTDAAPSPPPVK